MRTRRTKREQLAEVQDGSSNQYLIDNIRNSYPELRRACIPDKILSIKRTSLQIKQTVWAIKKGHPITLNKKDMQITPQPTYEVTNYETLNKFLLGTLSAIRRKEISLEEATAISQISDKIIKNNLTKIMDAKRMGSEEAINFFEPADKQVMIG